MTWAAHVVIFDLDDTLINFTGMSEEIWRAICDELAPELGVDAAEFYAALMVERLAFWNDPAGNLFGRHNLARASQVFVAKTFEKLGVGSAEHVELLSHLYTTRRHELTHVYEESVATIETLRARGHRLAMITNGGAESQREKIVRFDLAKHFDYVLIEGEFGYGKPDERVYHYILAEFDVQPEDAMMVGDDLDRDVAGPQKVGIRGVWIDRAGKGLPAGSTVKPDRIIRSLAELL